MAGISTSSFPFKPVISRTPATLPYQLSPYSTRTDCGRSVPTVVLRATITARFGGGGGFRPSPGDSRRSRGPRKVEFEPDPALDLSTIRSPSVRLIDGQQNMVILSPDADPPVVKIMDYNKYRYEQQKKKREQQKKSAASRMDMKELKMGYNIDSHDYSVRLKAAQKFLKDGDKVKIIVNLKGRENEFRNIAIELIKRFQNDVGELAAEESKNFRDRNIFIVLIPNKAVQQKAQELPNKQEKPVTEVSAGV